jgi:hypothetical protein
MPTFGPPLFSLVIYKNVPPGVDPDVPYSRPGEPIWDWYGRPTRMRPYAVASEQFFDPNRNEIVGNDTRVWQCNFKFDETVTEVARQVEGETYWLGVHYSFDLDSDGDVDLNDFSQLASTPPESAFGWKTADTNLYPPEYVGSHYMDDAVWTDVSTWLSNPHVVPQDPFGFAGTIWNELIHPHTLESLDLAFVITPEPASLALMGLGGLMLLRRRRQ